MSRQLNVELLEQTTIRPAFSGTGAEAEAASQVWLSNEANHAPLLEAVRAVDALNAWVRAPGFRRHVGCSPRKAIYWLKRCAIKALHKAEADCDKRRGTMEQGNYRPLDSNINVYTELIGVPSACRACSGSGTFHFRNAHEAEEGKPCLKCRGRGIACLYFVETRALHNAEYIAGWHTPAAEYIGWPTHPYPRPKNRVPYDTAWQPNQPGRDLTPTEAATALNVAESFFSDVPKYGADTDYRLYIGETYPNVCAACLASWPEGADTKDELTRCVKAEGPFEFGSWVCTDCRKTRADLWEELTLPDYLLTPAIVEWAARRGWNADAEGETA